MRHLDIEQYDIDIGRFQSAYQAAAVVDTAYDIEEFYRTHRLLEHFPKKFVIIGYRQINRGLGHKE
jgi:hypothetical protein